MDQISGRDDLKKHYQDVSVADEYVQKRFSLPKNLFLHRQQVQLTNMILQRQGVQSVLELACGPGRVTRYIDTPVRAVAVDASEQMMSLAQQVTVDRGWNYQLADIFELDLDEVFEAVYSFRFIRHFELEKRQRIYEIIRQHLKVGGTLIFDAPNVVVEGPFRARHPELYPIFDQLWNRDSLLAELSAEGFKDIRLHPFLKRHSLQRVVSFATKRGANELGASLIRWLDAIPGGQPLEWTVQCVR